AVVDGEMPGRDVGVGELPLEGGGACEAVARVDLTADGVEQQCERLGVARGRPFPHADHAGFRQRPPALGDLEGREADRQQRRSPATRAARSLLVIDVTPATPTSSKVEPKTVM